MQIKIGIVDTRTNSYKSRKIIQHMKRQVKS